MFSCVVYGVVKPEVCKINFENGAVFEWAVPDRNLMLNLKPSIKEGQVTVEVLSSLEPSTVLDIIYKHSVDLCRMFVGLVGFTQGLGLQVDLTKVVYGDGTSTSLAFADPRLEKISAGYGLGSKYDELIKLLVGKVHLIQVLNDLMNTLYFPHVSPVNCARVVDAIKHTMSNEGNDGHKWERMRKGLNVTEPYLKFITEASKNARHGSSEFIGADVTDEACQRTWHVVNRYLHFLLQGEIGLDKQKFVSL